MTTVLVIEDGRVIRMNIQTILTRAGFDILMAENGVAGVEQAKRYLPDLILCDVMMPHLDGYGVLAHLQHDPTTATIPFIFLTAKTERSDMRQGMNLGADDYLTKPFTSTELVEAIAARLTKQASIIQPYLDEMKRAADTLTRIAYADPLTHLPNRILLRQKLYEAVQTAEQQHQVVGVLCLNIDRFSNINAAFGGAVGDLTLRAVAERLKNCVGEQRVVARMGDDEFGVVAIEPEAEAIIMLAQQIQTLMTQPYLVEHYELTLQVSIGIALYPDHSASADQLLTYADVARRWYRRQGGNSCQLYSPTMENADPVQRLLETDLHLALERSEFQLYYQPQVNVVTGQIVGLEALLRWHHPTRGLVLPNTFIPMAEEYGLIVPLGEWALRTACREVQTLPAHSHRPLQVSVNVSARQLRQPSLVATIVQILEETQFNPKRLVLELTETSLMDDVDSAITILNNLKGIGIQVSIDDFGTGYSSLSYLRRLPVDELKVDGSFVRHMTENEHDAAIATAIIAMAKSLKLTVIAEGVETEAQQAYLRQQGCFLMQGYLYSPPLPFDVISTLLLHPRPNPNAIVPTS